MVDSDDSGSGAEFFDTLDDFQKRTYINNVIKKPEKGEGELGYDSKVQVANNLDEEEKKEEDEDDEPLERDTLPFLKDPESRPSIWTIIKDMIGKDISRIGVPVYFNDPTSLL